MEEEETRRNGEVGTTRSFVWGGGGHLLASNGFDMDGWTKQTGRQAPPTPDANSHTHTESKRRRGNLLVSQWDFPNWEEENRTVLFIEERSGKWSGQIPWPATKAIRKKNSQEWKIKRAKSLSRRHLLRNAAGWRYAENKLSGIPPWPRVGRVRGSRSKSSTKSMDKNVPVVKKN